MRRDSDLSEWISTAAFIKQAGWSRWPTWGAYRSGSSASEEPVWSNLGALSEHQGAFDVHAQVAYRDFGKYQFVFKWRQVCEA